MLYQCYISLYMAGADAPAGRSRVLAGQQPAGMAADRAARAPTTRPALLRRARHAGHMPSDAPRSLFQGQIYTYRSVLGGNVEKRLSKRAAHAYVASVLFPACTSTHGACSD